MKTYTTLMTTSVKKCGTTSALLYLFFIGFMMNGLPSSAQSNPQGDLRGDCAIKPQIQTNGCTSTCFGGSITLDAGEGYSSYLWSNGALTRKIIVNNPESSGKYSCTVTNSVGCSKTSDAISVVIQKQAEKPYIVQQGTTLTSTEEAHYTWFLDGVELPTTNRSIEITKAGMYKVMVTNEVGCTALSEPIHITSIPNPTADFSTRGRDARLRVYPNPSDGRITIQLISDYEGNIELTVHDLAGKQYYSAQWISPKPFDTHFIDLSFATVGTYILTAHDGVDTIVEKIIKDK
jgi:hypothetical protein